MPSTYSTDRNLLFGVLAVQMDFISKEALLQAMQTWVFQKHQPLGQLLEAQGALAADCRQLLEALVEKHLQQHDNNPEKSLAAIGSATSVRQELAQIADADVQASLASMPTLAKEPDPHATRGAESVGSTLAAQERFRILRPHARGGLGEVFVARDEEIGREVALKAIQDQHADHSESRHRFLLEAEITGRLEHPGIVPVYGLGQYADGRPFYAMRFIRGDSLKEAIERFHRSDEAKPLTGMRMLEFRKLLGRFIDVCNAIEYAHSRGVLHRDLKPGNIMLGKYGETLVVDWGLAKPLGHAEKTRSTPSLEQTLTPTGGASSFTMAGQALGTPAFMSPEQAAGKLEYLGPASDVYSLGATLYCLLTGKPPFQDPDVGLVLSKVQMGEFPRPRQVQSDLPKPLEAICLKAMALNPAERYPSPRALADDIEHWLADEPVGAWSEPWSMKARRSLARHSTLVGSTVAGMLVLLVGSIIAAALLGAANRREQNAQQQEKTARLLAQTKQRDAEQAQDRAEHEARHAQTEKIRAEKALRQAEWLLYVNQIALAQREWEDNNAGHARELLDACPPDLCGWEHAYLRRLINSNQRTLPGHTQSVFSAVFSPDGNSLASGSADCTVKVWNAAAGQETLTLRGHTGPVWSVVFSPDGKRFASGSEDATIKLWDVRADRERGRKSNLESLLEATFKLRYVSSGHESKTLKGHTAAVQCVAYSSDGKRLASGSTDQTIKLWDIATGRETRALKGHTGPVFSVAFSPDGSRLISSSADKTVRIWELASGRQILTLRGHTDQVLCIALSPDGKLLASASYDQTMKIWDAATGREMLAPKGHAGLVFCVAFSPDSKRLASGSWDQTLKVWDVATGQETLSLKGHAGFVHSVAFSPDGKYIVSASKDQTIKIWDVAPRRATLTLNGHTGFVHCVAFSPDGKRIVSASYDNTLKIWDAATGLEIRTLKGHTGKVLRASFSPDGKLLASASMDRTVKIWNVATWKEIITLKKHNAIVSGVAFSPDSKRLASASYDQTVKVFDVASGQEIHTLKHHSGAVSSVAFSPDGKHLVSASRDSTLKLWDAATGQEMLTYRGHIGMVDCVAFSPDGKRLASGSWDETVNVWDTSKGHKVLTLKGHTGPVWSVTFSPDGKRIVSGSAAASVKIWDADTGQETLTLKGHAGDIYCVAFSPDGMRLVSGSTDKTLKVWDASPPGRDAR